ncbi:dehydrogenase [Mesorhizobium tianshanense]|uniref:D-3-phosphoglycerate dehydrogenase n=1 Tax=Mesorhizobium tianshanense TaxID=39844 RepID=A0A562N8E3_9HYPH|nr:NAD(P)-dependent oxidoreductase [Mesorhizobium tianshanense]TWI28394.1 D-3-phosphoglycerate dehydrogenase [Mesorhizobium tianshanense]GLS36867.1 dehydrogenase [Mesorhizobium tianshanense]
MANAMFRVALSGDFRKPDGSPTYPDFDLEPLRNAPGVEMAFLEPNNPLRAEQLEDFDALILLAHRFDATSVPKSGRLAVVARFGVGYDTVDVEACTAAGIALVITPDGVRRPVAISVITFMLALTGKLLIKDALTRKGAHGFDKRSQHMGVGLVGRTLGSLGIGNIGAEVFRMAKPFDMNFIAHDPFADRTVAAELGIELVGLEDLFRRADVLSVSCPLTPQTHHIVNAERLALMKPTAYLINTARGPIVDQKALTKVLQERRIAGAGLDVLEQEPPDADDPILRLDNVILAPHALCWTDQCFAGNGAADVKAVIEVQHGREPRGVVNREVLSTEAWKDRLAGFAVRFGT